MAGGKLRKVAVIGAAIGGVIFFWRKRKGKGGAEASDIAAPEPEPEPEPEATEVSSTPTE